MWITVNYSGGRSYGNAENAQTYTFGVSGPSSEDAIELQFAFAPGVPGKSRSWGFPALASAAVTLPKREALRLADAIKSQCRSGTRRQHTKFKVQES